MIGLNTKSQLHDSKTSSGLNMLHSFWAGIKARGRRISIPLTSCLILVSLIAPLVKIGDGIVLMLLVYSHGIRVLSLACYSSD